MVRFRRSGLILVCVLAPLLAAPALGVLLQDEAELTAFHNHALALWPDVQLLSVDPVSYVKHARPWLSERIFPVQLVTRLQKRALIQWLDEPPEPRVSLGDDGHVFLNGGSNQSLYGLFANGCVFAHSDSAARALEGSLGYWTTFASSRALVAADFVVIPTAASLYADKLPRSTPRDLRIACLERAAGRSALLSVRPPDPSRAHFVYPLREMLAQKDDPAFYPKANWHPVGKSLQVVRDTYLASLGVQGKVHEILRPGLGPAEILLSYGIDWERPRYYVDDTSVSSASARNALVREAIGPLFRSDRFVTNAYQSTQPVLDQNALLITDSFGDLAAQAFAGTFRSLIQVNVNELQTGSPSQVIERVRRAAPIDRLIFIIQEGNALALAQWR